MKWRLLAAFAGLIAVVLLTQDIPLTGYLRRIEFERLISSLERDAFILAGSSENVLSGEVNQSGATDLQSTVDLYAAREGAVVVVTDAKGRVVASSEEKNQPGEDFSNRPEIQSALSGTPASGERHSNTAGGNLVYVAVPVLSGADIVGSVRITFPSGVIDQRTSEKTRGLLLVGGISLLGAAIAAVFMANSITRPIRRLQRSTEQFADGDFSQRAVTTEGAAEIRSLATSYNTMTEQISGLLAQQQAFAGDASHQLRTPLTALRLQLERASSMIDDNPEGARERIEAATQESERLQRLVEGLLMIARSEGSVPTTERIDVSTLVRDRGEVWEPFAAERGVRLLTSAPGGLWVHAVPNALEQIIDNYVDNALGVATEGDTITIAATQRHQSVGVHVIDEGPGMKPEHLARAFDRFWRAPDAPHGGSGIGLAVVQHLATLSGGRAELRNRTDRNGLDASVVLPMA
jgi:signal transduction histidine kinase